jgi:hypothetical protein
MRTIIQLCSRASAGVFALCNDGTSWELFEGQWHQIPEIPRAHDAPGESYYLVSPPTQEATRAR